ncbi:MAG: cytochrome c-type biogenesis protein CcmH [Betaproteobacteria bacterium]|nr:cytochrome c-type biogenesis protein CcmH [Betaproteobacteria bacterium]NBX91268.1 cytochrome c-type biogenesis protein CcmH [Betaproteobacteria bacterium]
MAPVALMAKEAAPMAEDPVVEKRMVHISEELRCLVCQNESLASSRAELATDLREEVRSLIRQGKSDTQIKEYLVTRYGDFVLYRPEVKALTWILWFGPFLLLLAGVVGMALYLRQRQAEQVQAEDQNLSEEERRRVAQLLKEGDAS